MLHLRNYLLGLVLVSFFFVNKVLVSVRCEVLGTTSVCSFCIKLLWTSFTFLQHFRVNLSDQLLQFCKLSLFLWRAIIVSVLQIFIVPGCFSGLTKFL